MTHYSNTGNPIDFPKLSAIDRLWGQALDQAVPETYSSLSFTQVEKVKTVFAELIVRECAGLFPNVYVEIETEYGHTPVVAAEYIKKHFGVEL